MLTITVHTTKEKHIIQMPEHANELRFKQFLGIVESKGELLPMIAAITGLPVDVVSKSNNTLLDAMAAPVMESLNIEYMQKLNTTEPPKQFRKNIAELTLGQKIEAKNAINYEVGIKRERFFCYPKLAEIYLGMKQETFLNGFLPDVYPIGHFFFVQSWILLMNGQNFSELRKRLLKS